MGLGVKRCVTSALLSPHGKLDWSVRWRQEVTHQLNEFSKEEEGLGFPGNYNVVVEKDTSTTNSGFFFMSVNASTLLVIDTC